jgi:hypothetical protein
MPTKGKQASPTVLGRPTKGGEKVTDYPTLSLRIRPALKAQLTATSKVVNKTVSAVVAEALELYFSSLPEGHRKVMKGLAGLLDEADKAS